MRIKINEYLVFDIYGMAYLLLEWCFWFWDGAFGEIALVLINFKQSVLQSLGILLPTFIKV